MNDDSFIDPLEWYQQNKHLLPEAYKVFEHDHVKYIFSWKKVERALLPLLTDFAKPYYPFTETATEIMQQKIQRNNILVIAELCEQVWNTQQYCFSGRQIEEACGDLYALMPVAVRQFKMTDDFVSVDNPPEWMTMIKDKSEWEAAAEDINRGIRAGVAQRRAFIDLVQPELLKVFPNILELTGAWWLKYEYDYTVAFRWWFDEMNRLEAEQESTLKTGLQNNAL